MLAGLETVALTKKTGGRAGGGRVGETEIFTGGDEDGFKIRIEFIRGTLQGGWFGDKMIVAG